MNTVTTELSLEEQLRDRLVCGVKYNIIQRRLLLEEKLTLKRAAEIAVALEPEYNLATIDSSHNNTPVHKIESNNETRKKFTRIMRVMKGT